MFSSYTVLLFYIFNTYTYEYDTPNLYNIILSIHLRSRGTVSGKMLLFFHRELMP